MGSAGEDLHDSVRSIRTRWLPQFTMHGRPTPLQQNKNQTKIPKQCVLKVFLAMIALLHYILHLRLHLQLPMANLAQPPFSTKLLCWGVYLPRLVVLTCLPVLRCLRVAQHPAAVTHLHQRSRVVERRAPTKCPLRCQLADVHLKALAYQDLFELTIVIVRNLELLMHRHQRRVDQLQRQLPVTAGVALLGLRVRAAASFRACSLKYLRTEVGVLLAASHTSFGIKAASFRACSQGP